MVEPAATFSPGQLVVWRHEPRGGYGYVYPVDAVVVRAGPKRVLIETPLKGGATKRVWVTPQRLAPRSA